MCEIGMQRPRNVVELPREVDFRSTRSGSPGDMENNIGAGIGIGIGIRRCGGRGRFAVERMVLFVGQREFGRSVRLREFLTLFGGELELGEPRGRALFEVLLHWSLRRHLAWW